MVTVIEIEDHTNGDFFIEGAHVISARKLDRKEKIVIFHFIDRSGVVVRASIGNFATTFLTMSQMLCHVYSYYIQCNFLLYG